MRILRKKAAVRCKVALPPRKAFAIRRKIVCKFSAGIAAGWKFRMATEDAETEFAWKRKGCKNNNDVQCWRTAPYRHPPDYCVRSEECIRVEGRMNLIFLGNRRKTRLARAGTILCVLSAAIFLLAAAWPAPRLMAQSERDPVLQFRQIADELSAARQGGGEENQARMEKALAYLDSLAIPVLNVPPSPHLEEANQRFAGLASHTPPVGENYRLVKLGGAPAAYAMAVNFGLGGPAALRIYAAADGRYSLAAKIDHFAQSDFFDSDIELVSVSDSDPVFVTISGRTDDLSTGQFVAWRLDGNHVTALWTSDLLQQSTYGADGSGFHLAYCSQVDEDHPSNCLKMARDLYRYQGGEWRRIETAELPASKPAP